MNQIEKAALERGIGVKSALRVLAILEHFASTGKPATLAQLTQKLDLPKSSCFGLLETLRQAGYLYWIDKGQGYYPTRRWADLGAAIAKSDAILAIVSPKLAMLRDATEETAALAKLDGNVVLYVDAVEPIRELRLVAHAGERKPIHSSASGRALLGSIPPASRRAFIEKLRRERFSDATPVTIEQIEQAVEEGVSRGWHVSVGEHQPDTAAIAASFSLGFGTYALMVGGPTSRLQGRADEIGALLAKVAQELTSSSGGS